MLEIHSLTKNYGNVVAVDNMNLEVNKNEVAVLVGPNGSGKTTTLSCIVGLVHYFGEISIGGNPSRSIDAKRCLGYVPESASPYDYLTIDEHLEFIAKAYQLSGWEKKAETLLSRMKLNKYRNKLGKHLSKGMKQKLNLCCALLPSPQLVILDEPMVGLDPHAIKELKDIVIELKQQGCAVLISTHILDSIVDIWDSAHIIINGKIKVSQTRTNTNGEKLEEIYFASTQTEQKGAGQ